VAVWESSDSVQYLEQCPFSPKELEDNAIYNIASCSTSNLPLCSSPLKDSLLRYIEYTRSAQEFLRNILRRGLTLKEMTTLLQALREGPISVSIEKICYIYSALSPCGAKIDFLRLEQCIYLPEAKEGSTRVWWGPDEVRRLSHASRRLLKDSYLVKVIDVHDISSVQEYHEKEIQILFDTLQVPNQLTVRDYRLVLENVATLKDTHIIEAILTEGEYWPPSFFFLSHGS